MEEKERYLEEERSEEFGMLGRGTQDIGRQKEDWGLLSKKQVYTPVRDFTRSIQILVRKISY
jgi:hypothetical protein